MWNLVIQQFPKQAKIKRVKEWYYQLGRDWFQPDLLFRGSDDLWIDNKAHKSYTKLSVRKFLIYIYFLVNKSVISKRKKEKKREYYFDNRMKKFKSHHFVSSN